MSVAHLVATLLTASSLAQNAGTDDWELTEAPGVIMASVRYGGGQAIAVRCRDNQLETFVVGLGPPPTLGQYEVSFDGEEFRSQSWLTQPSGISYSTDPKFMGRRMRVSRQVSIRAPSAEGPARRYDLDLPSSSEGLAAVFDRCGSPLSDERDALGRVSEDAVWRRRPVPVYPDVALQRSASGVVGLSCVIRADGRPEDCRVEMAAPTGLGFEESALRAARDARLELPDPADQGRVAAFIIRFSLPD